FAFDVAVDGGRVVAAGSSGPLGLSSRIAVARFLPDGSPDPSFGQGGWAFAELGDFAFGYALAVVGGEYVVVGEPGGDFALARFSSEGGLLAARTVDFFGESDVAADVVEVDGSLVLVGAAWRGYDFDF